MVLVSGRHAIAGALGAALATLGATVLVVISALLGLPSLVGGVAALLGGVVLGAIGAGAAALLPVRAPQALPPATDDPPDAPDLGPVVAALAGIGPGPGDVVLPRGPEPLVQAVRDLADRLVEARRAQAARDSELREALRRETALVKHLQAELQMVGDRERAATEVRDAFLTRMSHELRTPLNAILGYVELLEEEAESDEQREDLGRVRSSALNLLAIVTTVLDLTQLQSGSYEIVPEPLDLAALTRQVADSVRVAAEARGNRVEVDVPDGLDARLDRRMVQSILFNLASNGYKYTKNGTVTIRARMVLGRLQFVVTDTGIGMTERQIEEAFRPFDQADASTTRRYDGVGLGLAVVRGFAEAMEGAVKIDSQIGQGATVRVDLPRECAARVPSELEEDEPTMLLR
jgi:signal transduction histidine kinase